MSEPEQVSELCDLLGDMTDSQLRLFAKSLGEVMAANSLSKKLEEQEVGEQPALNLQDDGNTVPIQH